MDLSQEMTTDAAAAVKTPDRPFVRDCGATTPTAGDLRNQLDKAKSDLQEAIESADLEQMTALRAEIKSLAERITLATMRELKERLNQIELGLSKNEDKRNLIRSAIASRKLELQTKLDEIQPFYDRLNKAAWEQSFADNEHQMLLVERREKKALLFNLTTDLQDENL